MKDAHDLITRLVNIADALGQSRTVQISDAAIRQLREEIETQRLSVTESLFQINYQHVCLIECIAELAYARSEQDVPREERAKMYINTLRTFVRIDLNIAERKQIAP